MVVNNNLSRASWPHPIFNNIHEHNICIQEVKFIYSNIGKTSGTIKYAFFAFILTEKSKTDIDAINYWLSEKLNCVSEVSSWMLLGFLFTFLFIVTHAISFPIAWAFSKPT